MFSTRFRGSRRQLCLPMVICDMMFNRPMTAEAENLLLHAILCDHEYYAYGTLINELTTVLRTQFKSSGARRRIGRDLRFHSRAGHNGSEIVCTCETTFLLA